MTPSDLPFVNSILRAGAEDAVFGGLMVAGPVVLAAIAAVGRTSVTVALAGLYVAVFAAYVPYKGLVRSRS